MGPAETVVSVKDRGPRACGLPQLQGGNSHGPPLGPSTSSPLLHPHLWGSPPVQPTLFGGLQDQLPPAPFSLTWPLCSHPKPPTPPWSSQMFTTKNNWAGLGKGPRVRYRLRRCSCQLGFTLEAGEERGNPRLVVRGTSTGHRLLPGEAVAGSCGVTGEPLHTLPHVVGSQARPASTLAPFVLRNGDSPG